MTLESRVIKGTKSRDDYILEINTKGEWHRITFVDLLLMIEHFRDNENRLYPPQRYRGAQMLYDAISEVFDGISVVMIKNRYHLTQDQETLF